jgi:hypothetical protein
VKVGTILRPVLPSDDKLAALKWSSIYNGDCGTFPFDTVDATEGANVLVAKGVGKRFARVNCLPLLSLQAVQVYTRFAKNVEVSYYPTSVAVDQYFWAVL